jgi:hypothetical protein
MSHTRPGARLLAILASLGLLVTMLTTTAVANHSGTVLDPTAGAPTDIHHVHPVRLSGNNNCPAGSLELRIQSPATASFPTPGPDNFVVNLTVVNDPARGGQYFNFTTTGGVVTQVFVKAGPDTNRYNYAGSLIGPVTGDNYLHGPINTTNPLRFFGLSHLSFCYSLVVSPTIVTQVSDATITIGDSVTDTATLSGGNNPTGTIAFNVYGPNDATCTGTATLVSTETVNGNGNYTSDSFTPTAVGTYRWIASYSGDANNAAVSGACNDANETVVVSLNQPSLSTTPNVLPNDSATLSGLLDPSGGTITFKLFLNAACTGDPLDTWTSTVNANGTFTSSNTTHTVSADTVISWIVEYSGDAKNAAATSGCAAEQADVDFTPLQP